MKWKDWMFDRVLVFFLELKVEVAVEVHAMVYGLWFGEHEKCGKESTYLFQLHP